MKTNILPDFTQELCIETMEAIDIGEDGCSYYIDGTTSYAYRFGTGVGETGELNGDGISHRNGISYEKKTKISI